MKIVFSKKIYKDFDNIDDKILLKVNEIISILSSIKNLSDIYLSIKKIKWFNNYYRIRIWDFRLWIKIVWDEITLIAIKHRKDIYKFFP